MCAHVCGFPQMPGESNRSLGARVTGGGEPRNTGARNQIQLLTDEPSLKS